MKFLLKCINGLILYFKIFVGDPGTKIVTMLTFNCKSAYTSRAFHGHQQGLGHGNDSESQLRPQPFARIQGLSPWEPAESPLSLSDEETSFKIMPRYSLFLVIIKRVFPQPALEVSLGSLGMECYGSMTSITCYRHQNPWQGPQREPSIE